jgi:hypothetical protein
MTAATQLRPVHASVPVPFLAEQSRHARHRDCKPRREEPVRAVVAPVRYRVVAIRTATGRMLVNRPLSR